MRVDCPLPACAQPLVARVTGDDDMLVLMSERDGANAALDIVGRVRLSTRAISFSFALGAAFALFVRPAGLSGAPLALFEIGGAASGLAVLVAIHRVRARRNAARLLDAVAHVPRALEAVARGYR